MERFAVTAATGALGPVLVKLAALLGDEYKLQEGAREDIMFIKSELEPVHDLLGKLWGREDLDVACRDWVSEARELSYDMEDDINRFTLALESGDMEQSPFKKIMGRVKGVSKLCGKMQEIREGIICNSSKMTKADPRPLFLHRDSSELVGMEERTENLIELLHRHDMVCIVGFAGMGKTTLADLVYQAIGGRFDCQAFVSLDPPSPKMTEILGCILCQVTNGAKSSGSGTDPTAEQTMINDLSIFLSGKRYLVVIDGIWHWSEWEVIRKALPKNNLGCKTIMTTRISVVAEKCQIEERAHVYMQSFGYEDLKRLSDMRLNQSVEGEILEAKKEGLSTMIANMSGAMPLAVICLSSAWAESHTQGDYRELDTWVTHLLMDRFLSTPSLKPLVQSLCLGFDDLPVQLRTCLLYCSIYPWGRLIERDCLVRKWIAEGFVSQEEAAEAYFNDLVSRNLLQQAGDFGNKYRVHPLMLAFLVCTAKQENFVSCRHNNYGPASCSHAKQIRRLSLYSDRYPDEDVSHTRSLIVAGPQSQLDYRVPLKKFKNLKVLEIDSSEGVMNSDLVDICGLILLRYLGLRGCSRITELPRNIGELKNLETLDVSRTNIIELPKEIGKLQHLRTLDVRNSMVRDLSWEARQVPKSLSVIVGDMDYCSDQVLVKLPQTAIPDCSRDLSIVLFHPFGLTCKPLKAPMLRVAGSHMKVPRWVKQELCNVSSLDIRLCKLGQDDLEFLKQMPNLQALALRFEVLPQEPIVVTGGGFSKLETFYFDCRLPRVTFQHGAMPKLKHLEFVFYAGPAGQVCSMGVLHLPRIENVVFRSCEYYTSDGPGVREIIEVVRKEAAAHPNSITVCVNDREPEAFRSTEDEAARRRVQQQQETEERERIRDLKLRAYQAAERRAQQQSNKARRGIRS